MAEGKLSVRSMHVTTWDGPVPPPAAAEAYERIHPGAFDRLLTLAESEAKTRREQEAADHAEYHRSVSRGQAYAFVLTLVAFICGTICAFLGQTTAAVAFVGATVVNLAAVFIGRSSSSKGASERKQSNV